MRRPRSSLSSVLVFLGSLFVITSAVAQPAAQPTAEAPEGEALYNQNCATCHAAPTDLRTPPRAALGTFTTNSIYHALTQGLMQAQGSTLSEAQKIAVAEYLTGRPYSATRVEQLTQCASPLTALDLTQPTNWNGWANGAGSPRHQPASGTAINADNIGTLELAWAFGMEEASGARAQPSIIDGVMFMGSNRGDVYALDLESGCAYWTFLATTEVRGSLSVVASEALGRTLVVGADASNRVFALDALTGEKLWHADVDPSPWARSTGSPVVHGDKIFVPVSSAEVVGAGRPDHPCCTFRGNVAAFDLNTGEKLWHTFIMEEAKPVGTNSAGVTVLAPSGAPIWDAPTIDGKRNRIYVGTGQNYSRPASATSDSVIAFNMDTGNMDWILQTTSNDAFTMACTAGSNHPNCPDPGPDLDIGAPILSTTLSTGKDILVAGTKGAVVFGLDPDDNGKVLWQTRVGRGGPLGGVHWGMTFVGDIAYVPVSDRSAGGAETETRQPGLHAIDMKTGERLWFAETPARCATGQTGCMDAYSAPASATDDLVVTGSLNGYLFAHDQRAGELVWEFNTAQDYTTVNAVPAKGGAIDSTGPVFSGDYMIVNSGYATFGQMPGNAVLVFKLPD
ncbi:MAG: PQQ-binding-like beta-propeller repeat protein [Pseudohongiellaceae bacterium]